MDTLDRLEKYAASESTATMKFPSSLTGAERAEIHANAQRLGLRATREGSKDHGTRFISVRKLTAKEVRDIKKKQEEKKKLLEATPASNDDGETPIDPWSESAAGELSLEPDEDWADWEEFATGPTWDLYKALGVSPP